MKRSNSIMALTSMLVLSACSSGPKYHSGPIRPIYPETLIPPPVNVVQRPMPRPGHDTQQPFLLASHNPGNLTWARPQQAAGELRSEGDVPVVPGVPADLNVKVADDECSIGLTMRSMLDLYRTVPHGCQASPLRKVNAWRRHGNEIELFEQGGRSAGMLTRIGEGTYAGATLGGVKLEISQ